MCFGHPVPSMRFSLPALDLLCHFVFLCLPFIMHGYSFWGILLKNLEERHPLLADCPERSRRRPGVLYQDSPCCPSAEPSELLLVRLPCCCFSRHAWLFSLLLLQPHLQNSATSSLITVLFLSF